MEKIKAYFEDKLDSVVSSITILNTISKRCKYCGYGEIFTGEATIAPKETNEDSYTDETRDVTFVYRSGCLTYDEEMDFE